MMGRLNHDHEQWLDEAVPQDHPVREVAAVLDLSWVHSELAPYYPRLGRPWIDPVLMIRMLIIGYVFGIRSTCSRAMKQGALRRILQRSRSTGAAVRRRRAEISLALDCLAISVCFGGAAARRP